jgi:hypothetical protein
MSVVELESWTGKKWEMKWAEQKAIERVAKKVG